MTITIEKSVDISAPLRQAYDFWADFARYPSFMPQVRAVEQVDDTHWRWRADVGGKDVSWDAEITEQVPEQSIGWQTTSKGTRSTTTVRFQPLGDGRTTVTFTSHYPNGVGKGLSPQDLAQQAEDNLKRFAALLQGTAFEQEDLAEDGVDEDAGLADGSAPRAAQAADDAPDHGGDPVHQDEQVEQDEDQSTSDVLGSSYSFKPDGAALNQAWQERATSSAGRGAGWLDESGLARSLDAFMAFNPLLPFQPPRAVMQHGWFSSMFQMVELPLSLMKRWSQEMDRTLDTFVWGSASRRILAEQAPEGWSAAVDVDESEESLKVRADLPGVADDDEVEVEVRDGQLVISGEVRHQPYADGHEPASDGPADGSDQSQGRFVRSITLPAGVDAYGAQASLHDGVLEVTLAGPALRQRRIEVSHGQQRH